MNDNMHFIGSRTVASLEQIAGLLEELADSRKMKEIRVFSQAIYRCIDEIDNPEYCLP